MAGPGTSGYSAAKHSVNGITKAVRRPSYPYTHTHRNSLRRSQAALEARSHGIRVNAVSPGFLPTKIGESVTTKNYSDLIETKEWSDYEARQGRKGHPDEIGDVVVLLSTPRMSLVNGHNLVIDGYVNATVAGEMISDE